MSYKLTYFDMRGRAECIRMIFAAAGVKFEDNRVKGEAWPALKLTTTWGQIPVLEVDGNKTLAQTVTICRYLGRKFNLSGDNDWEEAKCNEYVDAINDLFTEWAKYFFEKDEEKKKNLHEALKSNTIPKFLSKFNELKGQNQGGFLIGKKLTWADIFIADKIDRLTQTEGPDVLEKYPYLLKFRDNVFSQPNLKSYIDQRPFSSQ